MRPIIVLEPNIANKIAAGEVVERPASIVKELLENSIDAGATSVTVEMQNGGIDHIRITDNGCGIPAGDVKLAFKRHATSKLTSIDDLDSLSSFGFRGEALASIAAVSKVTMRTRTVDAEYGIRITASGGEVSEPEICACPTGTTIEVDELFFNVPARLKFVKNVRTEAAMITDYASRIMLANPGISIKLINSGRTVLHTIGDGSLANAILCVYGSSLFSAMYEVDYDDGYISIKGYVGGEATARANRIQQSVFVNNRFIKSMLISNAVQRAYLTKVMKHRFPFFVLNILISSREVDVNVHPNKLSVRFGDEERVARAVTTAVDTALGSPPVSLSSANITTEPYPEPKLAGSQIGFTAASMIEAEEAAKQRLHERREREIEKQVRDVFRTDGSSAPSSANASAFSANEPEPGSFAFKDSGASAYPDFSDAAVPVQGDYPPFVPSDVLPPLDPVVYGDPSDGESEAYASSDGGSDLAAKTDAFTESGIPVFKVAPAAKQVPTIEPKHEQISLDADTCTVIGAAFDTYIIVQQGEAIYYIDQHAAHERILYEKLVSGELKFDSQFVSPPLELEFDPIAYDCLLQHEERFSEFGYSIEFGSDLKARIFAVPSIIDASPDKFLRDAVDMMLESPDVSELDLMRSRLIQMSCKRAVKAGDDLDISQLKAIVDAYASGDVPLTCPHGRPVIIRITKTELQKMFKRIV